MKDLPIILYIANKAGLHGTLTSSTVLLAAELDISQQTVSRKLQELDEEGSIKKQTTPVGVTLSLTEKGKGKLRMLHGELQQILNQQTNIAGIVKDGLGEGKFYMSQEQYKQQFQSLLNFTPYPGTLNLAVDKNGAEVFLAAKKQLYVSGFQTKERTFGGLKCYPVLIAKKIVGAVIVPDRTTHTLETVEIIAAANLRSILKLENGKEVAIQ